MTAGSESSSPTPDPSQRRPIGFLRNSVWLGVAKTSTLLTFVVHVFAARRLGDSGFGEFTLGLTIASLLFILPAWGTNRYSSIMAARTPEHTGAIVADNLGLTSLLAVLYIPLVALAGMIVSGAEVVILVALLLGLDKLISNYSSFLHLLFRVHDVYALESLTAFLERITITVAAVTLLLLHASPAALALAFLAGRSAGALVSSTLFLRRIGPIRIRYRWSRLRRLLRAGTPLALRRGLGTLNFRVDMLLLGWMQPSRQVGWYAAATKLVNGFELLPAVVQGALGPSISSAYAKDELSLVKRLYRRSTKYLLVLSLFPAAFMAVLADPLVDFVYGGEYRATIPALRLLALVVPAMFLRQIAIEMMDNVDLRGPTVKVFAFAVGANIAANLLLIPRLGHLGAAWATLGTEILLAAGLVWILRREGFDPVEDLGSLAPFPAALLAGAAMLWLITTPVAAGLVGATVYLVALTILGTWDDKDRALMHDLWGRVRSFVTK